jgi:hypothetical protein
VVQGVVAEACCNSANDWRRRAHILQGSKRRSPCGGPLPCQAGGPIHSLASAAPCNLCIDLHRPNQMPTLTANRSQATTPSINALNCVGCPRAPHRGAEDLPRLGDILAAELFGHRWLMSALRCVWFLRARQEPRNYLLWFRYCHVLRYLPMPPSSSFR